MTVPAGSTSRSPASPPAAPRGAKQGEKVDGQGDGDERGQRRLRRRARPSSCWTARRCSASSTRRPSRPASRRRSRSSGTRSKVKGDAPAQGDRRQARDRSPRGNEANNAATLTVSVKGEQGQNGDFEQANASGSGPEGWTLERAADDLVEQFRHGRLEGRVGVRARRAERSAASPTWTSAPVAVVPGETLDLRVSVNATGTSSPANAGVVFLGSLGQVLNTVNVLTAPLTTSGFQTLESSRHRAAGTWPRCRSCCAASRRPTWPERARSRSTT